MNKLGNCVFLSTFILVMQSCTTYKNVPYFQDVPDSAKLSVQKALYKEIIIQSGDILNVTIQTIDPQANAIFSQIPAASFMQVGGNSSTTPSNNSGSATTNPTVAGYLVNDNGQIELPLLGKISVGGLTTAVATDTISRRVAVLYKMPTVSVRFANLKISVLGEVARPGTYILPNEKNTILDALAMAGDLTIFGKRENLLLIRDSADKSNFIRFSLNGKSIVNQNFYYLRQNDVLYVEPNPSKLASLDAARTRTYAIAASILSLLIVIATRVK